MNEKTFNVKHSNNVIWTSGKALCKKLNSLLTQNILTHQFPLVLDKLNVQQGVRVDKTLSRKHIDEQWATTSENSYIITAVLTSMYKHHQLHGNSVSSFESAINTEDRFIQLLLYTEQTRKDKLYFLSCLWKTADISRYTYRIPHFLGGSIPLFKPPKLTLLAI